MKTTHVKASETEASWCLYDASEHTLGRMAAHIATRLIGKHKPTYTPSELCGDFVVVIQAEKARVTGKKSDEKEYQHYTGYPGGRVVVDMERMRERRPNDIVKLAVRRMLPKGKLGRQMLKRLKVYSGTEHNHTAQQPVKIEAL
jgi:large subunit ribosomal protein L13